MKLRLSALAMLLLACGGTDAQEFLPPPEAAEAAIEALPMVRAARFRVEESRARGDALEAGPYGFQTQIMPGVRNEHHGPMYSEWEAQLTRSLRLPDKAALDRALGEAGIEAATLAVDDARHAGARVLLARWFEWLRAAHQTRLLQTQRAGLVAERDAIARRAAVGDVARLDVERAQAAVAEMDLAVADSRRAREEARVALVSDFPDLSLPPSAPVIPPPPPSAPTADEAVALIVARSHEIGIAEAIAARQALTAQRSAAERRPDPSVGLRVVDEGNHQEQLLGLVLSWSFPTPANRAEAVAEGHLAAARAVEAEAVRRDIEREARRLTAALPARVAAWQAASEAVDAGNAALTRVERAYALGEAGFADLSLARRQAQAAAEREIRARLDLHETRLRIDIDSHELWARHFHHDEHDHTAAAELAEP